MKVHSLVIAISACMITINTPAQTRDVCLEAGINVPMSQKAGTGSDIMLGVNYGQFYYNGLGFRTGIQYSASTAGINDVFGVPIAFAYRTPSKTTAERFRTGASGARDALNYHSPYGNGSDAGSFIGGFLINLLSEMEFFAGITPGYVAGPSESPSKASWGSSWQYWEDSWVEKKHDFSLTLDAGMSLNYSIWRFDIKLTPAVHYNLTKNYIYHVSSGENEKVITKDNPIPIRWFFTINGGLAFRF